MNLTRREIFNELVTTTTRMTECKFPLSYVGASDAEIEDFAGPEIQDLAFKKLFQAQQRWRSELAVEYGPEQGRWKYEIEPYYIPRDLAAEYGPPQ